MDPRTTPTTLNLKKDEKLEIHWQDGQVSVYPIAYLRRHCPCASCKTIREEQVSRPKRSLNVLTAAPTTGPVIATSAQLVGGYALQIDWSDNHSSGIYSFQYLREISLKN